MRQSGCTSSAITLRTCFDFLGKVGLRMNPDRYAIIYDSKYDSDDNASNSNSTTTAQVSSSSSTYSTSPKVYRNYYYNKYHEGILEIAKGFLKIMTNQIVDKTMVAAVQENV